MNDDDDEMGPQFARNSVPGGLNRMLNNEAAMANFYQEQSSERNKLIETK